MVKLMEILFFLFIILVSILIVSLSMVIKSKNYKGKVEWIIISVREEYYYYKLNRINTYYPSFRYTVDGITYECEYPYGEASLEQIPVGKKVLLKYDVAQPEKGPGHTVERKWRCTEFCNRTIAGNGA